MKTQTIREDTFSLAGSRALLVRVTVIAVYSFLIPRAALLKTIAPFAVAFTGGLPLQYAWLGLFGSGIGYLTMGLEEQRILYLSSMAITLLIRLLLRRTSFEKYPVGTALLSGGALIAVTLFSYRGYPFEGVELFLRICEGFTAGGMTYLAALGTRAFLRGGSFQQYQRAELVSGGILGLLLLIALMEYRFLGFHPGIILATVVLLVALEKYGMVGGTVAGVMIACALSLYQTAYLTIAGILVLSAMIGGIFSAVGRLAETAVFLSVSLFGIFIFGITVEMLFFMMDILIGCGCYFMIPQKRLDWLSRSDPVGEKDHAMKEALENRLDFAARTVEELQLSLQEMTGQMNRAEEISPGAVYGKTISYVCRNCGLNLFCWDECYNDTVESFTHLMQTVRRRGVLQESDLEEKKPFHCCRKHLLIDKFNEYYQQYLVMENARKRAVEVQMLATEQLSGVSRMLWEVSSELSEIERQDTRGAALAAGVFEELYAKPQHVFCSVNAYDRMEVDFYFSAGVMFDKEELCEQVGRSLQRSFVIPSVVQVQNQVRVSLYEEANFTAELGSVQLPYQNGKGEKAKVCGDSFACFHDEKGNVYLLLSDGMGHGESAARDSKAACELSVKLLKSGFGMEAMLRFLNSSFRIRSEEEALVTLDVVKLDLYTGRGECYKAGGADGFARSGQSVVTIESLSLPTGIMQAMPFEKKTVSLNCGDFILLCSDGLLEVGKEKLYRFLQYAVRKKQDFSAQEWAEGIKSFFLREMDGKAHDDVSILVLKLNPGVE